MEIDYRSLANLRGEDVIQVTSLTESHKYPFVAVKEAIIEMNDGKLYRVVATDENISGVTKEVQKLMHRAVIKQRLVPRDGKYAEFQQCEEGNLEDERKYDAVYDEYIKNLNSKKDFPTAVLVGTGAAAAVAITAAGVAAYNHSKSKEETPEENPQLEEGVQKPEIKGTSIEFYLENAPESEQLTFEQSFYPAFDSPIIGFGKKFVQ